MNGKRFRLRIPWLRQGSHRPATPLPFDEGYARWADTYPPAPHNPLMTAEQETVTALLSRVRAERSLDLGTGTGRLLPLAAATGATLVVGVDRSLPMLARVSRLAPRICADARVLPFADGTFDLVTASLMAGDIEDVDGWIAEISRVLRPGGHLVYSDFHPSWTTHGWRRTFTTPDGREFELPYFPHSLDAHLAALAQASCRVRAVREPRVPGRRPPVVAVFHAERVAGC